MNNIGTIRETVSRLKTDGMPVSEYSLRAWVRTGKIPAARCGAKALLFYPNVLAFLQSGAALTDSHVQIGGIRRIET